MTTMTTPKSVSRLVVLACGFFLGHVSHSWSAVDAQPKPRVFEIRTYTAAEGRLAALHGASEPRGGREGLAGLP
jgi:hypothetical protein